MEIALIVIQLLLGIALFLIWIWLKGLPQAIHKRQEQLFQQQLTREIELMKISQSQIQLRKVEKFIDFAKLQTEILTNDNFKSKIEKNEPKTVAKLKELVVELGIGLFFFASDSTVEQYGEWKTKTAKEGADPYTVLTSLGNLMVSLRKDVGYENTKLGPPDYLRMFITDWDEIESKFNKEYLSQS